MGLLFTSQFEKNVQFKQKQRQERIAALTEYHKPLTSKEQQIVDDSVAGTVKRVQNGELKPREVLKAFGKRALEVQAKNNPLTEIMIKDAETWADEAKLDGPLAGFPVSLKDSFIVKGYDSMAGFAGLANMPFKEDGATARIIKAAGGYPYVRTNVPSTMMAIEGYNDVWGRTTNPHNPLHAPGGSSQGEGALIAGGGSRIGIGTDIGGSVRVPAAWCGITSLRFTTYRFPFDGDISSDRGFEGVTYVASPMAKTVADLRTFIEAVFSVKPWEFDYHLIPMPWKSDTKLPEKPRVGVLNLDDFLPLTPAQDRALKTVASALKRQGCEIVEFKPPRPSREYDNAIFTLYQADGYKAAAEGLMKGEHNDPYVERIMNYMKLPGFIRSTWQFLLRLFGFKDAAARYAQARTLTVYEYEKAVTHREDLRRGFRKAWDHLNLDFMISAPHPSPAVPNLAPESFRAILYTSLFNLLDYPSGILPVDRVNPKLDKLPKSFDRSKQTYEANVSFDTYDAEEMAGLPTSVQVIAMRYHDEEALAAMELVSDSLHKAGVIYK